MILPPCDPDVPPHVVGINPGAFKYTDQPDRRIVEHHIEHCVECRTWARDHDTEDYLHWLWAI